MDQENKIERKIVKTGPDNSGSADGADNSESPEELKKEIQEQRIEQQKVSRLTSLFFMGLFLAYLLYIY